MSDTTRGVRVAGQYLSAAIALVCLAVMPLMARADDSMVDSKTLPRLAGAQDSDAQSPYRTSYSVAMPVAATRDAVKKLLTDAGWMAYVHPSDDNSTGLSFKKGPLGLLVGISGTDARSIVDYDPNRIEVNLPVPVGCTDLVFNENRPYLNCTAATSVDDLQISLDHSIVAMDWAPFATDDIAARYPNANLEEAPPGGARLYYSRADHAPMMLTLARRAGGRVNVDIRLAPFALPQQFELGRDEFGLPAPKGSPSEWRRDGAVLRELKADVISTIPPVLAFYRRELPLRGWKEDATGAVDTTYEVRRSYSSAEGSAVLVLTANYDLTSVSLVIRVSEEVVAARAQEAREAEQAATQKFRKDAEKVERDALAASDAAGAAAATLNTKGGPLLRAGTDSAGPVPVPEGAEGFAYKAEDGNLEFNIAASVKAVETFYRAAMKPLGWKEQPSVINRPNMRVLEFAKGAKDLSLTIMQLGATVNVTGEGSGLKTKGTDDDSGAASDKVASASDGGDANAALEADDASGLPVPKQHTLSAPETVGMPGGETPFRRELQASVPAKLDAVLAFYRAELTKRNWTEAAGASVTANKALVKFTSPEGPAVLKLGRSKSETTVNLSQKISAAATKAGSAPPPGQVRLLFGNMGDSDATLTIAGKSIKVAPGVGGPQSPNGPKLELAPGTYKLGLTVAGHPQHTSELEFSADDTWGLMVGPGGDGVLPIHLY
jgi:hypothetical protein